MAAGYHGAGEARHPAINTNDGAYGEAKMAGIARNGGERYTAPRLLEVLEKDTQGLIVELNELRERLEPLMGPEMASNVVSESHVPPGASQVGCQVARIDNAVLTARELVRSIKAQVDL